ncbi:MAG: hypothetical protein KGK18_09855 [Burkholderiales bacterium]|nr:hypothetical protein [Burkholderiales bacterium]
MKGYPRGFLATRWAVRMALLATGLLLAPTTLELRLGWHLPWRLGGGVRDCPERNTSWLDVGDELTK